MSKGSPHPSGGSEGNLIVAVFLLTAFAGASALGSAYISGFVLDQLQSTEAMALIITDGGIKSDSKELERNLSTATLALNACRDLGWALSVGCIGVGVALGIRWRGKTPPEPSQRGKTGIRRR
jgi:hypothetical protein